MSKSIHSQQGVIKKYPEDFCVNEIPLYAPAGTGEHLYLGITKTSISHEEMISRLAAAFQVPKRSIGTAGRKDKHAITTQVVSIHLPENHDQLPDLQDGIEVQWSAKHNNKLRLGHLIGNRFDIRIREVDPIKVAILKESLQQIQTDGLPNAYGPQRFGNKQNNHLIGLAYLNEDWQEMQRLLNHEHRSNDQSPMEACQKIHRSKIIMYVQALQSHVFNQVLQTRIDEDTWNTCLEGDLAWSHIGKGSSFLVTQEELQSKEIEERTQNLLLSPTGPVWGVKMRQPSGYAAAIEEAVLNENELTPSEFASVKKFAKGQRRPLRVPVHQSAISAGVDSRGYFVRVQFELPSGSYATVLIDRLLSVLS